MALPVSVTEVDYSSFVKGLPYYNAPLFNLQLPPAVDQHEGLITGYVLNELQQHADKNPLRTCLYNLCRLRSFNNNDFLSLVVGVAEYADVLLRKNYRHEDAIREATVLTCAVKAATLINEYPEIKNHLSNEVIYEANRALTIGAQVKREVPNTVNNNVYQPHHPQNHYNSPAPVGHVQYQQPQFYLAIDANGPIWCPDGRQMLMDINKFIYHPDDRVNSVGQINPANGIVMLHHQPPQQNYQHHQSPGGHYQQPHMHGGYNAPYIPAGAPVVDRGGYSRFENPSAHQPQRNVNVYQPHYQPEQPAAGYNKYASNEPQRNVTSEIASQGTPTSNRRTVTAMPNQHVEQKSSRPSTIKNTHNGIPLEEACKSMLVKKRTDDQPFALAYNPLKEKLLIAAVGNNINLHLTEAKTEEIELEYLQHELNPLLRAKHKSDLAKALIKPVEEPWLKTTEQIDVAEALAKLNKEGNVEFDDNVYVENTPENPEFECTDLLEGINMAASKLKESGVPAKLFNFTALIKRRFKVEAEVVDFFDTFYQHNSLTEAAAAMVLFKERNPSVDFSFWYLIDSMFVKKINDMALYGIGIGGSISSFVDDAKNIYSGIEKIAGVGAVNIFKRYEQQLISDTCNWCFETVENGDKQEHYMVFKDKHFVLSMPYLACELQFNVGKENYGIVMPGKFPKLHELCDKMSRATNTFDKRVIVSADGAKLYVHVGLLQAKCVVISLV